MDMSKAAIAPRQPLVTEKDRQHPLFAAYNAYRSGMSMKLLQASSFRDWLGQREVQLQNEKAQAHVEYPAFLKWMRDTKGGARECQYGGFPHNFYAWVDGARW